MKKSKSKADESRKVYVGFWTSQDTKDEIKRLARDNRQSMSACVDGLVEYGLFTRRTRRSR